MAKSISSRRTNATRGDLMAKIEDTGLDCDYAVFFKDKICKDFFNRFPSLVNSAKNDDEVIALYTNARLLTSIYSLVVYKIYPNVPEYKEIIDSDKELASNFQEIKEKLDANEGERMAEQIVQNASETYDVV